MISPEHSADVDHFNGILDGIITTIRSHVDKQTILSYRDGEDLEKDITNLLHHSERLAKRVHKKFAQGDKVRLADGMTTTTAWMVGITFIVAHGGIPFRGNIMVEHMGDLLSLPQNLFQRV